MDTLTKRTIERLTKAVQALEAALALPQLPEHAERDAALLRFEFAADVALPKDIVRAARAGNLVDEDTASALLAAIDDRNRMVHDYSEEFAVVLHGRVKNEYINAFKQLLQNISNT